MSGSITDSSTSRNALPQPEPDLTPEKLIARARALRPMLFDQQDESDRRGFYSDAVHRRMIEEGFYRILQPKRFGGYEFDLMTFIKVVMEISRGHPGAGWCYTLAGSHGLVLAAHWPEQAQEELFGKSGEFRSPMVVAPSGRLKPTQGGYTVEGTWAFASGVPVSTHFMAGALLMRDGEPPINAFFVVPCDKIEILPDWGGEKSLGMRASGSNSVRIKNAFVPESHVITTKLEQLMMYSEPAGTPGTALHGNPMYLGLFQGWFSTEFGAILTGTARAALDEYEHLLRTKKMTLNPQLARMHDPNFQRVLGEAMGLTDSAEALTFAATQAYMDQCEHWAKTGTPISIADSFRVWGLSREACKLACEAVEKLFHNAGASIGKQGERLQRYFRDAQMYRIHIQSQPRFPTLRAMNHLGLPIVEMFGS